MHCSEAIVALLTYIYLCEHEFSTFFDTKQIARMNQPNSIRAKEIEHIKWSFWKDKFKESNQMVLFGSTFAILLLILCVVLFFC